MTEPDPEPIYRGVADELDFDPLPTEHVHDDHVADPIDPAWFDSFDEVDSREIQDPGAPA